MHLLTTLLLCILSLLAFAASAPLHTHIVRFKNKHARDTYLTALRQRLGITTDTPQQFTVQLLDDIFIGAIISHATSLTFDEEHRHLSQLHALSADPTSDVDLIESYEQDAEMYISEMSRVTQQDAPWHLDRIDQDALPLDSSFAHIENPDGDPVNVYVVDTGVRITHEEFEGRARAAYSSQPDLPAGEDCNSHGTHVAALVAGKYSGVNKNAIVHDVRVMDCGGRGSNSGIILGLNWIAANARKPAVVNLSLGGASSEQIDTATRKLYEKGILPVVAAGNEVADACTKSPARVAEALTVGASTDKDLRAPFSNYGSCVDVYAPGYQIRSASHDSDDQLITMSGTSMSAPIVAGVVSVYLSQYVDITPAQLKARVLRDAVKNVDEMIAPLVKMSLEFVCPKNHGGFDCTVPMCGGKLATHAKVCSGHGECSGPNQCQCETGYSGANCEQFTCFGERPDNLKKVCSGHGQCKAANECECINGFTGERCEVAPPITCFSRDAQDSRVCSGHGACAAKDQCDCEPGYSGEDCSAFSCFGKSAYSTKACSGNGYCVSVNNCTCHEGYSGVECASSESEDAVVAVISGSHTVIGADSEQKVTFSGESSFHKATNASHGLQYEWTCEELKADSRAINRCIDVVSNAPVLQIDAARLNDMRGGHFEIRLAVSKDEDKSQASTLLVVEKKCDGECDVV